MKFLTLLFKKVKCPLLNNEEIEDDQCWHCHKYKECFSQKK